MYIKSIELNGFKSYAKKQVIQGFHPQFNAITGYNGSGKSNILDGICFLLGLSKLENIRAKNMIDLIYKQGQAGVNKAVVTIIFDNTDKENSPYAFANDDEIVIRRQIVVGTNKGPTSSYTVNGQAASNNRIYDLFRSVGLNVNNPHFLIMQGRITKVLNMKPEEILGMIEEAAGTRMYDQKKRDAEKVLIAKDSKLNDSNNIIKEILEPRMEKIKEERKNLIEVNRLKKLRDGLQRKLDAYIYWQSLNGERENRSLVEETRNKMELCEKRAVEIDETVIEKEKYLAELEAKKNENYANSQLEEELKKRTEERVNQEGDKEEIEEQIKQIEIDRERKKQSIAKDQKLLEKKKKDLEKILLEHDSDDKQQKLDIEEANRYRLEIEALSRGMMTNEQGEQVSIEQKIQECRTETAELEASIKTAQNREKRLKPRIQELTKSVAAQMKRNSAEMKEVSTREAEVKRLEAEINKLNFDEAREIQMKECANSYTKEIEGLEKNMSHLLRNLHRGKYEFVFQDPPIEGFNREKDVLGTVVTLFRLKKGAEKYSFALEMAFGSFLYQVVVSTQNVARIMVEKRVFLNRRTLIPVVETRKKSPQFQPRLSGSRWEAATNVARQHNEEVVHLIDLIDFDPQLKIILENILGGILVTDTLNCAKHIAYHPEVRTRVVTIRGDDVKPNGVMSGGHTDRSEGDLIVLMKPYHEWKQALSLKKAELAKLQAELEKVAPISRKYYELKEQLIVATRRLETIRENIKNSELGVMQTDLEQAQTELEEVLNEIKEKRKRFDELMETVKKLESRKTNDRNYQEKEKKKLRAKLDEVESRSSKYKETRENASRNIMAKKAEVEELAEQIKTEMANCESGQDDTQKLKDKLQLTLKKVEEAMEKENLVRQKLDEMKKMIRAQDDEMKKLMKSVDGLKREKLKIKSNVENLEKESLKYSEYEKVCRTAALKQKKNCEWITQEEEHFGKKGSEYDFEGFSENLGSQKIKEISANLEALERKMNTKATTQFDNFEAKVKEVKAKRDLVDTDKKLIMETLKVLDQKKVDELYDAYHKVNEKFSSIFSTLLPGATAKLVPYETNGVLTGVEVKVSFNGQEKESLQELSGGQRSLVALSLVLAMLKFHPAPLYILDEIDAALDLSHTANIGEMIKKNFKDSQFIVVSLKEGMFRNADVLFRTKFVDGTSTVQRTVAPPN